MQICRPAPNKTLITKVEQGVPPAFTTGQRNQKGARRLGYLFEDKINKELSKLLGKQYAANPWLKFYVKDEGSRECQLDGMYIDVANKLVTVVECKYTFCPEAWYQINTLYRPVIEAWFPNFKTRGVQVFKNFLPQVKYPELPEVIELKDIIDPSWSGGNKVCHIT